MKKKIFFGVATGLFAVATVFNMNLLQGNSAGDVSLNAIEVMSQAEAEHIKRGKCYFDDWTRSCEGRGSGCSRNRSTCY